MGSKHLDHNDQGGQSSRLENQKGEGPMTCFFCKGNLENSTTTHMIELPHCILIVKNVPCHRCDQCGEITLSSDVIEELDKLVSLFESAMTEVAVVNYPRKSA
jgi:YgiT-type zinc finger domain-containing protein